MNLKIFFVISFFIQVSLFSTDLNYEQFKSKFSLGELTTELHLEKTRDLSFVMKDSIEQGLKILHSADKNVIEGYDYFYKSYMKELIQTLSQSIERGGRLFFIGSGSSGRIALDLSAKWRKACDDRESMQLYKDSIVAIIAGGGIQPL